MLDPFVGSGTTAEVAAELGRWYLGFDNDPKNEPLQEKRTRPDTLFKHAMKQQAETPNE